MTGLKKIPQHLADSNYQSHTITNFIETPQDFVHFLIPINCQMITSLSDHRNQSVVLTQSLKYLVRLIKFLSIFSKRLATMKRPWDGAIIYFQLSRRRRVLSTLLRSSLAALQVHKLNESLDFAIVVRTVSIYTNVVSGSGKCAKSQETIFAW